MRLVALSLILTAAWTCAACRSQAPGGADARARELLARFADDEAAASSAWLADPRNRTIGLSDHVAGAGPLAELAVETTRELALPSQRRAGCLPADAGPAVFYRTTVSGAGGTLAVFHWPSQGRATAGHRRVRTAVAAARGNPEHLWGTVASEPELDTACAAFRDHRPPSCPS